MWVWVVDGGWVCGFPFQLSLPHGRAIPELPFWRLQGLYCGSIASDSLRRHRAFLARSSLAYLGLVLPDSARHRSVVVVAEASSPIPHFVSCPVGPAMGAPLPPCVLQSALGRIITSLVMALQMDDGMMDDGVSSRTKSDMEKSVRSNFVLLFTIQGFLLAPAFCDRRMMHLPPVTKGQATSTPSSALWYDQTMV